MQWIQTAAVGLHLCAQHNERRQHAFWSPVPLSTGQSVVCLRCGDRHHSPFYPHRSLTPTPATPPSPAGLGARSAVSMQRTWMTSVSGSRERKWVKRVASWPAGRHRSARGEPCLSTSCCRLASLRQLLPLLQQDHSLLTPCSSPPPFPCLPCSS